MIYQATFLADQDAEDSVAGRGLERKRPACNAAGRCSLRLQARTLALQSMSLPGERS